MKSEQIKTLTLVNPTLSKVQKSEEQTMKSNQIAKMQSELLGVYLSEYCEVNGIDENQLENTLSVKTFPLERRVMVYDEEQNIKMLIVVNSEYYSSAGDFLRDLIVCGQHLNNYPKTLSYKKKLCTIIKEDNEKVLGSQLQSA